MNMNSELLQLTHTNTQTERMEMLHRLLPSD